MHNQDNDFEKKYLNGLCDALAIGLSAYYECPVRAVYPVHHKVDGTKVVTGDFLHAYVVTGQGVLDAKGFRSEAAILGDFQELLNSLLRDGDSSIGYETVEYLDSCDFVDSTGCNPEPATLALQEAAIPLSLDESLVFLTLREMENTRRNRLDFHFGF